jgi:hypothetical protein
LRTLLPDVPEFLETAIERALAKDPDRRFSTCREMKDFLSAEAAKLPTPLSIGAPLLKNDISEDVERCRRRITALVKSGDLDLAQRVLDSARIDYPDQDRIERLQTLIEEQRKRAQAGPVGERRARATEILNQLINFEKKQDWNAARELVASGLTDHPELKALQMANLYLRGKAPAEPRP